MSAPPMQWPEIYQRVQQGEDLDTLLDERSIADRRHFAEMMANEYGRPDIAADYLAKMREIDLGIDGARSTWNALSFVQLGTLIAAASGDGRLERVGKEYRHSRRHQPYRPIYVATVRNLCARELMAWDGGAFDPEAAAVITERGRFVLAHGPVP